VVGEKPAVDRHGVTGDPRWTGVWFRADDAHGGVTAEIHVGVEDPFVPAPKAHPALQFHSVSKLEEGATRLTSLGFPVDWSQRRRLPGERAVPPQ